MQIDLNRPILELNQKSAEANRELLSQTSTVMLNLMASPGAGKTSLILATIEALRSKYRIAVIEGDIASDVDAQKIKAIGIASVQINTGGACHLEANMINRALDVLDLDALDLIIVENVGNLVCPTEFDLGETARAVILSVPEGDDKPLKYPNIFAISDAILVNKIDALPLFDFNSQAFNQSVHDLNPKAPIFKVSAKTTEGLDLWCNWLEQLLLFTERET